MALENVFLNFATELDASLIEGMNHAITEGISWARLQITTALSLYVIGYAFMTMHGKVDSWAFVLAGARAMAIGAILVAANYNYYVRDLFFNDLPNQLARAINGPRVTVNSAEQFDIAWSAVLHYSAYILSQASGWSQFDQRFLVWLAAMLCHASLWVCFGMWYISRVFMAIVIALGPFLIILALFRSTREYVQQWIGKLVGLTVLGLASAILLRMILLLMFARLRSMEANPGMSVDMMIGNAFTVSGIFMIGAVFMIALPSAVAIGAGMGAGHAVASGLTGALIGGGVGLGRSAAKGTYKGGEAVARRLAKMSAG